jgi:hypothetical protein
VSFLIGSIGIANPSKVQQSVVFTVRIVRISWELASVGSGVLARSEPKPFQGATRYGVNSKSR